MAQITPEELQSILSRIGALENLNILPPELDYNDPILYYQNPDGTPADPSSIEKVPELINGIPIFEGKSDELSSWIKDVDALVKAYQICGSSTVAQKNKFYAICTTIRRKIKGEANTALVNSDVNINWNLIKKTLLTYYGEKRDLTTLDYQLMNVSQSGRSLEIYYDEINRLLSLIAGQIKTNSAFSHPEACRAMISMYNKKAIDAFIRGLDGDIGKFLKNYDPESLANAYAYCITYQNIEFRKIMAKPRNFEMSSSSKNLIPIKLPPRLPPRFVPQQHSNNHKTYQPMQTYVPQRFAPNVIPHQRPQQKNYNPQFHNQNFQNSQFRNHNLQNPQWNGSQFPKPQLPNSNFPRNPQNNPFMRKPTDKPEPMEIDESIRSRQINYTNRPPIPNKNPRQFNIQTINSEEDPETEQYFEQVPYLSEENCPEGASFERYSTGIGYQEGDEESFLGDEAELNFLG